MTDIEDQIKKLTKENHDKEMLIDELERRVGVLEKRMNLHEEIHSIKEGEY